MEMDLGSYIQVRRRAGRGNILVIHHDTNGSARFVFDAVQPDCSMDIPSVEPRPRVCWISCVWFCGFISAFTYALVSCVSPCLKPLNYEWDSDSDIVMVMDASWMAVGIQIYQSDPADPRRRYYATFVDEKQSSHNQNGGCMD
ncbi:hypothetical protein C8F01DRAFT_1148676 [Mycena amicta]|nr:hypothetical protein C8F01DRAFT_1148676 [Mycena amicta]